MHSTTTAHSCKQIKLCKNKNILVTSEFHRIGTGTSTMSISNCIFIKSAVQEVHFSLHDLSAGTFTSDYTFQNNGQKMTTACHWYNLVQLYLIYPQRILGLLLLLINLKLDKVWSCPSDRLLYDFCTLFSDSIDINHSNFFFTVISI